AKCTIVSPPASSTPTAATVNQTVPVVDQCFCLPDLPAHRTCLSRLPGNAGMAGSEGAGARQRAPATRLETVLLWPGRAVEPDVGQRAAREESAGPQNRYFRCPV